MRHTEALFVDPMPVDEALRDPSHSGPELAHLAGVYVDSPRALVFLRPSSDWRVLLLLLPLGSRLSLMVNPIFAQLARTWGLGVRFIGVDHDHLVYDFRTLLSDRTLNLIIALLTERERATWLRSDDAGTEAAPMLDLLFDALASEMLTTLERRRGDWTRHLARDLSLDSTRTSSLFKHSDRHPDFIASLRRALRSGTIDIDFYGRVLRAVDQRESAIDARITAIIEDALRPSLLNGLARTGAGRHLGCYNWLSVAPRHAPARLHLLTRLPAFAHFLAETLMPIEASARQALDPDPWPQSPQPWVEPLAPAAHTIALARAIDGGQDRAVIGALATQLSVSENLLRRLWRDTPHALQHTPGWLLPALLRRLDQSPERNWPREDSAWQTLIEQVSDSQTA